MLNSFKTNWLNGKFLFGVFTLLICFAFHSTVAQAADVIPYSIKIESRTNALPGDTITLNVIKTDGTEMAYGFDFMIGFDQSKLSNPTISYGELFIVPGDFEWELLALDDGPFPECGQGGCPSGLIELISMADTDNGIHHPIKDPETGKIKVIPNNTVLFSINFQIADYLDPTEPYVPVFFFWTLCSDNQVAFAYDYDGPYDVRSAFSRLVMDSDGLPGWINITDYNSQFPTNQGAPEECILLNMTGMSERLCDFFNGGVSWGCSDVNSDGRINILDIIFLINLKYKNGPLPNIEEYGDLNNDTSIDILDIVYLLNYIYKNGPQPDCPQP